MPMLRRRRGTALALLGAGIAAISAGCGSTGGSQSSARIRVADVATNAATANILINNASAFGDLAFQGISPYLYVQTGTSTFSYTTTAIIPTAVVAPASPTLTLNAGQFYTVYLIGRSDVTGARFLKVVATDDTHASAGSQALVRILDAAPDAGSVDVLVNGAVAFSGVKYPPAQLVGQPTESPATAYQSVAPGAVTLQADAAGTSTVVISPAILALKAGQAYTVVLTEPSTTPTYSLDLVSD